MANTAVFIGVVSAMIVLALGLGIYGIAGSFTADITSDIQADQVADSYAYNISSNALAGQQELSNQADNVGQIGGLALVLLILLAVFGVFINRRAFG